MNIVWFRNDLRLADNPALCQAVRGDAAMAVYFLVPGQWRRHSMAGCRVDFLLRTLRVLRRDLHGAGFPLLVRRVEHYDDIPTELVRLCAEHGVSCVYWNNEYPLDEARRDEAVEKALAERGIGTRRYHDRVVAAPGTVVTASGAPYRVFTPFKKCWMRLLAQGPPAVLPTPPLQAVPPVDEGDIPDFLEGFNSPIAPEFWPAGEGAARERLAAFCDVALDNYHRHRDSPALEGTSRLSPYLAVGSLSPRQCLAAALSRHRNDGVEAWVNELAWRDFFQHIVAAFPHVCRHQPFRKETEQVPWRDDEDSFGAWCQGRTGVPIVDAGMRQLLTTGWMHNRVRMITAMFLCKNLLIDWRRGERFFMEHLIDGDFAANNGGWQWCASTGTDAVPYFRIFNPFTQARRLDPEALYIKTFVGELAALPAEVIHHPDHLSRLRPSHYPDRIVDIGRSRQRALDAFKYANRER